ncbi:MAG: DegT/DnrJ/EryC1/StrS family aminotransferase [Acidobacteria bacterium]|nr:DegT/DnrJ/EryC1/StrS family aminotransferase [Acidobacteriota bacterium]MBS1867557.1 DegT/DnrJ/EryC1/StrS family aminotransferase [Acidobacteriota bacterium]
MASTTQPSALEPIHQFDLSGQYAQIGPEIREVVERVLASQQLVLGKEVAAFEKELAEFCGVAHGVGVANGTDALILALRACNIYAGDEVLIPTLTFVATASAVNALAAKPVFADVDRITLNLDPADVRRRITPRTKAIIAVHLHGLPADMDPLREIAKEHKLPLIEDNAQAIGASYKKRYTGSLADIACISFYPTKNLGAAGDGGMIVTNSLELDTRLRTLRNHGQASRYVSAEPGWNSRLDEIQAAILRVKLRHLRTWQKARQTNATKYSNLLSAVPGIRTPFVPEGYEHVFHQYTIRSDRRDALQKFLTDRKIGTQIYYPIPLHLQPLYANLGHKRGDFPNAEHVADEILSLPMYPELSADKIERVTSAIAEFARQ